MSERDNEPSLVPGAIRGVAGSRGNRTLPPDMRPRVLLADDHPGLLMALKQLLERSCAVVGTVRTGADALEAAGCLQPDVMVTDVRLPDIDGLEVCRRVRAGTGHTRVVVITAADDPEVEQRALELGASGFVLKYRAGDDLMSAIERALVSPDPRNRPRVPHDAGARSPAALGVFDRCLRELPVRQDADVVG